MRLCSIALLSMHREAMPNQSPAQLANLRPFKNGHRHVKRADSAKSRTLHGAKLASPECLEFALSVMRDVTEHTAMRLRAMEAVLRVAFPPKALQLDDAQASGAADRYMQIIFVRPGQQPSPAITAEHKPNGTFTVPFDAD